MNKLNELRDREDGFTLIELLIVVLIIGILAAIAIPVYLGIQDQAKKSAVQQSVNSAVTTIQVNITEGQSLAVAVPAVASGTSNNVTLSNTVAADNSSYTVSGQYTGLANYTYTYNSSTGAFTAA